MRIFESLGIFGLVASFIAIFVFFITLPALLAWFLWNECVIYLWPARPYLSFWVCWGLLILLGIIRGSLSSSKE